MMEPTLFDYPAFPGFKARETSRSAAVSVAEKAPIVRQRILGLLCPALQLTADEAADILKLPILTVRPRFSELAAQGLVEDSGVRRFNSSGRRAIVWRITSMSMAA